MNALLRIVGPTAFGLLAVAAQLRADVLEMQNGDRYSGQVLSMSTDTVVFKSEVLGKINVPRSRVTTMTLGTNAPALKAPVATARPPATNSIVITGIRPAADTNADLSAAFRQLGGDTNFIGQIRQRMFAGNPEGAAKFDEMVNGLMSGQIDLSDIRKQAKDSADQLRQLKRELGPEADESLDGYLKVLDGFLAETANEPANARPQP